jgi:PAS domain S-box-containing protein
MGTQESSQDTPNEALGVFTEADAPCAPMTASEVADELDCARRTAYSKLEELADEGELETKKVGARGRVWWRPREQPETASPNREVGLEEAQFHELVRAVTDYAIFLLDPDGVVQTWNEGARQLKGYEEEEILGEHFSTFYTEEDRERHRHEQNLATATREGRVEDEGWRVRNDGSRFWANVTITALHDDDGDIRGYTKVTRDMTERHEYEERLEAQRDELDDLNQINAVIRDIDQALVTATSREEIEQAVCNRLAESDTYSAAWTAEYTDDYEDITPRTGAGVSDEYLDAIRAVDGDETEETEKSVGATSLRSQSIQSVQQLQRDLEAEPWREATLEQGFESAITVPLVYNDVEYGILTVYADNEAAFDERKVAVMNELGETVSHAIAAIMRKEREQTLTALQESTRRLLHADTRKEIGDIIIDTLTDDLALSDALVYHFDTTENALQPVSSSFQAETYTRQLTTLTTGTESPVWTSFMEEQTQITESVLPAREIGTRRTILIPLGDHGVLTVAAADRETFDENTQNLVELVAATAEAAFDRVESQANLRERDELLQEQNKRLQRLNQINTIIREVDQGLVQATTRNEVQRIVCDRLTESDRFRFAWIGSPNDIDGRISPEAWGSDGRGYLDNVELASENRRGESEPAVTAIQTGDVTVVPNVAENLRSGQWRKEAFSREFQSAISVPLIYGDVTYGVLTVYADRPEVFDEMEQTVFAELGDTVANAINAVDTKQALLNEQAIELEFQLQDESASLLAQVAREVGCDVSFEGVIPLSEDRARVFFVAHDTESNEVEDVLERSVAAESSQLVATRDGDHLFEAVISGPTITLSLFEHGASLRSFTVTEDGVQLVVDLPGSRDLREFIEQFQSKYEGAEFVARRERERPIQTRSGLYAELQDHLTDRQFEVLKTAYYGGYFDSPRQSTGGDIAELLDVSQPTITEQLRAAECKLLDLLFSDGPLRTQ